MKFQWPWQQIAWQTVNQGQQINLNSAKKKENQVAQTAATDQSSPDKNITAWFQTQNGYTLACQARRKWLETWPFHGWIIQKQDCQAAQNCRLSLQTKACNVKWTNLNISKMPTALRSQLFERIFRHIMNKRSTSVKLWVEILSQNSKCNSICWLLLLIFLLLYVNVWLGYKFYFF